MRTARWRWKISLTPWSTRPIARTASVTWCEWVFWQSVVDQYLEEQKYNTDVRMIPDFRSDQPLWRKARSSRKSSWSTRVKSSRRSVRWTNNNHYRCWQKRFLERSLLVPHYEKRETDHQKWKIQPQKPPNIRHAVLFLTPSEAAGRKPFLWPGGLNVCGGYFPYLVSRRRSRWMQLCNRLQRCVSEKWRLEREDGHFLTSLPISHLRIFYPYVKYILRVFQKVPCKIIKCWNHYVTLIKIVDILRNSNISYKHQVKFHYFVSKSASLREF